MLNDLISGDDANYCIFSNAGDDILAGVTVMISCSWWPGTTSSTPVSDIDDPRRRCRNDIIVAVEEQSRQRDGRHVPEPFGGLFGS